MPIRFCGLTCCVAWLCFCLVAGSPPQKSFLTLEVPAFTAYSEPDPEALEFSNAFPITGWADNKTSVVWYGQLQTVGELAVAIRLRLPGGDQSKLQIKVGDLDLGTKLVQGAPRDITVSFGSLPITKPGAYRFALSGLARSGPVFGDVEALLLQGSATKDALFNLTPERGAPSVHLNFSLPDGTKAEWFYNEVTVKTDPLWSYYEACGFARGYFGIQINSPTERRIIFSVWDSGNEPVDRSKVAAQDRVQLLKKGPSVFASDFGNEGTGGHSHLVYPWKTGDTYRFLVRAQPEGSSTIYSAYFYFPEKKAWGLMASFRAPKDGGYLRGLYSFNEDFEGANGQLKRLAEFGNQWVKTVDGQWIELTKARFTHTALGQYKDRIDRGAGVIANRFYLTNGGFEAEKIEFNDEINRPPSGQQPQIPLDSLPTFR
jgi:hypothetical protein